MTTDSDRELLKKAYACFNARELEAVLTTMHPDVDWPNGMEGGRVYKHAGVRDYWTRQWGLVDPHVEPVGFETLADGRVAVMVHQVVRQLDGAPLLDHLIEHVYTIEDGLIRKMEIREIAGQ